MSATIRLTWGASEEAASYNIYYANRTGLSVTFTPLLTNTSNLTYDHVVNVTGHFFYIVAAVGPNGEIGPPSNEIDVFVAGLLVSITVTPTNPNIAFGSTQQFTATGHYSDSSTANITNSVTWVSGTPSVGTINSTGLFTTVLHGTSSITATQGPISGNTTTTVTRTLSSIVVTPANFTIMVPNTQQYTATGHYNDGSTQDITSTVVWVSTDTNAATIASGGLLTVHHAGTPTISATLGVSGSTGLTVTASLTSITVTPANATIAAPNTQQYTATGTYSDSSTANITSSVTWDTSNHSDATINGNGLLTSIAAGSITVSATLGVSGSTGATITLPGFTVLYDKIVNKPSSAPSGYSHAPVSPYNSGMAKIGNTIVAANPANAWFTNAGAAGNYPFLTSTDNGSTWAFTSWAQTSDSNMSLDNNTFYAPDIWATTDKFLGGCSGNQLTNLVSSTDGITWSTAVHAGTNIKSIASFHSTNNSNIWAVCDGPTTGTVVIFNSTDDGATWTQNATLTSGGSSFLASVFTISSTDVWIAGATNSSTFNSCVYHYNGSGWTDCSTALKTAIGGLHGHSIAITGIWASGTNDVYFIDSGFGHNQLYHTSNQGTTFTVVDVDPANSINFNGIGGTVANDIYLAGYSGNVYHSTNGTTWTKQTLPGSPAYIATDDYLGVYNDGSTIYIVGPNIIKK